MTVLTSEAQGSAPGTSLMKSKTFPRREFARNLLAVRSRSASLTSAATLTGSGAERVASPTSQGEVHDDRCGLLGRRRDSINGALTSCRCPTHLRPQDEPAVESPAAGHALPPRHTLDARACQPECLLGTSGRSKPRTTFCSLETTVFFLVVLVSGRRAESRERRNQLRSTQHMKAFGPPGRVFACDRKSQADCTTSNATATTPDTQDPCDRSAAASPQIYPPGAVLRIEIQRVAHAGFEHRHRDRPQRTLALRRYLHFAGALHYPHVGEGLRQCLTDHHRPVVAQ